MGYYTAFTFLQDVYIVLGCAYVFVTTCCDIVALSLTTMCHAPIRLFDTHKDAGGRPHVYLRAQEAQRGEALAQSHPVRKGQGWIGSHSLGTRSRGTKQTSTQHSSGREISYTTHCCFLNSPRIYIGFIMFAPPG